MFVSILKTLLLRYIVSENKLRLDRYTVLLNRGKCGLELGLSESLVTFCVGLETGPTDKTPACSEILIFLPPSPPCAGRPEIAASLIFGTFLISLFLIMCVASFFYLKRANKLPNLFYRRSKGNFTLFSLGTASIIVYPQHLAFTGILPLYVEAPSLSTTVH